MEIKLFRQSIHQLKMTNSQQSRQTTVKEQTATNRLAGLTTEKTRHKF